MPPNGQPTRPSSQKNTYPLMVTLSQYVQTKQNGDKRNGGVAIYTTKKAHLCTKEEGTMQVACHMWPKYKISKRLRPLLFRLVSEASSDDEGVQHANTEKARNRCRPHFKGYGTHGTTSSVLSPTYAHKVAFTQEKKMAGSEIQSLQR